MYKLVDKTTHEIWLGTEKAVIQFADDKFFEKDEDWIQEYYHKKLEAIGFTVNRIDGFYYTGHIENIELAIKYLQTVEDIEVVDIGDVLEDLKNNSCVLISQAE